MLFNIYSKNLRLWLFLLLMICTIGAVLLLMPARTTTTGEATTPVRFNLDETEWDDYLWPTDGSNRRTSDFAEFRKTHFHGGIDISTGMRTGANVFASRSGWVHSLTFEPYGYGWYLVLRHYDGYYTCYAHLDRPIDHILEAWYEKLRHAGRSFGEIIWDSDTIFVQRGDVIAYTGETGAGPPHLHFEIRDRDFNPVNPGLSKYLRPIDSLPPEVKGVMLVPLDAGATINGKWEALQLNPVGTGQNSTIRILPVLRGRIGLMLRAHDRANTATDYPTPYKIRLEIDGKTYFTSIAQRFVDTLGFHIRIDRDHKLMQAKKGEYRKLFREEGNLLEFYYPQSVDAGVLTAERLGGGKKNLKIIAEDLSGNIATVSLTVMLAFDNAVHIEEIDDRLTMKLLNPAGCKAVAVEETEGKKTSTIARWEPEEVVNGVHFNFRKQQKGSLCLVTTDSSGNRQIHSFFSGKTSTAAGRLQRRYTLHYDEIVYDIQSTVPFTVPPIIRITQGIRSKSGRIYAVDARHYRAVLPTWEGFDGQALVTISFRTGDKVLTAHDTMRLTHISARKGGVLRSDDGLLSLHFAPADVFRPMLCAVEKLEGVSISGYKVQATDIPLSGRPYVQFSGLTAAQKMFVSVKPPMRKYAEVRASNSIIARIGRFLGSYILMSDDDAPNVTINIARNHKEAVRIAVQDALSGIDLSKVVAKIDGAVVPLHYNENLHRLFIPAAVLKRYPGNELTVTARDRVGNVTEVRKKLR